VEDRPQDTLGPAAKKAPADYKEPQKRIHHPTMCRPKPTQEQKQGGLKIVAQRERWRDVEPEGGTRKFPAREVEMQRPGGLKIIRDEISGEMFKEKRSQVMSFQDLTGSKRTFRDKPGFKDPSRENQEAWPGMKGHPPDHDKDGNFVDYSLKHNGGFLSGKKMLNDVVVTTPFEKSSQMNQPLKPQILPSHGLKGRTRYQGVASLLAWD